MAISNADFEQLSQLLDGELDATARHDLERRIASQPELAETWHHLRTMNAELRRAYGNSEAAGVPDAVRTLLGNDKPANMAQNNVIPLFRRRNIWPVALAASLVLAVSLALFPDGKPGVSQRSGMTLATALETLPSGDDWTGLDDGRQMRAVLTFPDRDGGWCREFLLRHTRSEDTLRGVACRTAGDWHTEVMAPGAGPDSSDVYRPAGAGDSSAVQGFIRDRAADIPLDGKQEATLIERSWR